MGQLRIDENTVIYVVAPAGVASGGPELLHQLSYHLRIDLGLKAYMYYYPPGMKNPVHPEYAFYGNPFVTHIKDEVQNIIVVPEEPWGIKLLSSFTKIQKVIWWLSVNYAFSSHTVKGLRMTIRRIVGRMYRGTVKKYFYEAKVVGNKLLGDPEMITEKIICNSEHALHILNCLNIWQANLHLCQSHYALNFLSSLGLYNIAYLSDYINPAFLSGAFDPSLKEDIVVFNPKKGLSFTKKILNVLQDVRFVAIDNMTRSEVVELLKKAKVYIDFGPHPGKDRLPREAAILGCCVVVGKRGSAANSLDVPIPDQYKFEVVDSNIPSIIDTIRRCLRGYEEAIRDFEDYRKYIRNEQHLFMEALRSIFGSGV